MQTLRYRSIWISDLHLGTKHTNSQFLLDFLKRTQSKYLYLVGDIIDFWKLENGGHSPHINNHIMRVVLKKVRTGTKVVYIPGNHDEVMRKFSGSKVRGIRVQNETVHKTINGSRLLVTHGDEFECNVGDWVESCSALTESFDGSLQIMHWTDREAKRPITIHGYGNCYGTERLVQAG